jgi:cell division protein ZapD
VDYVLYEQPLNERMRTLLRLEFLFGLAAHCLKGDSPWDSRIALDQLFAIDELAGRAELRTELSRELDRHNASLARLQEHHDVDHERLQVVLDRLSGVAQRLTSPESRSNELKHHELLSTVRQRRAIPGGTCAFDLPAFHRWLQQPAEARSADVHRWFGRYDALKEATQILLSLVRQSATAAHAVAETGFYQQNLDSNRPFQLVQVALPESVGYYPEISGGRHRFTIRFMEQLAYADRPMQVEDDVEFRLTCCVI